MAEPSVVTAQAVAAPIAAQAKAPAWPTIGQLANAVVINTFDAITNVLNLFPANPVSEFISGGLLLVRREWLNQAPTVNPYQFAITASGQMVGTLDAIDPEDAPMTYVLKKAPTYGSVTVGADGLWTYTPGPDFAYGQPESFTVTVSDGGHNIFLSTTSDVTIPVGLVDWTNTFKVQNLTAHNLQLESASVSPDRNAKILKAPPIGWLMTPGSTVSFTIDHTKVDAEFNFLFRDPSNPELGEFYSARAALPQSGFEKDKFTRCWGPSCVIKDNLTVAFGDAPGELVLNPTDKNAKAWLNNLQNLAGSGVGGLTVKYREGVTFTPRSDLKSISGSYAIINNTSSNADTSVEVALSTTVSTQETKSWEVGTEVSASVLGFLTATLRGQYGESYTVTNEKTESTTVTTTAKPYSFVAVSAAAPVIEIRGDLQFKFAGIGPTYTFKNANYYVPDQRVTTSGFGPVNVIQEPLQEGVWLVDDKATLITKPVYKAGDQAQLAFYGYSTGPVGADGQWSEGTENLTNRTITNFSSSNTAVATVDDAGVLTAIGPGVATIRAQYNWTHLIDEKTSFVKSGEVYGSIDVTVNPA